MVVDWWDIWTDKQEIPTHIEESKCLPNNMRNSHGGIINCDTKIVNWLPVAPHDHKISKRIQVPSNLHDTIK